MSILLEKVCAISCKFAMSILDFPVSCFFVSCFSVVCSVLSFIFLSDMFVLCLVFSVSQRINDKKKNVFCNLQHAKLVQKDSGPPSFCPDFRTSAEARRSSSVGWMPQLRGFMLNELNHELNVCYDNE